MQNSRQRFREVLARDSCVVPASVYDPLSARIAEDIGFETGMLGGSVASLTVLGAPDLIVLTLSELAEQVRRICRASALPVLVDADHGFGNGLSVKRTVEELETAGAAALTIEDTRLPQPFGETRQSLVSVEEGVGKIRAAIAGRSDPDLVVMARTSAPKLTGLDDAVERCWAYEAAGADAVFLVGLERRAELEALCSAVGVPVILGSASSELQDRTYLAGVGVRMVLQPHLPIVAAVQAVYAVMRALRDGEAPEAIGGLAPADLMKAVSRQDDYERWERDFRGA